MSGTLHQFQEVCRKKVRLAMRNMNKPQSTFDYEMWVGCDREHFRQHMHKKLDRWNELSEQRIQMRMCDCDHICPFRIVQFLSADLQENACRMLCHYTNLQPLPGFFNRLKSDHWSKQDHSIWLQAIFKNPEFDDIYWPVHI